MTDQDCDFFLASREHRDDWSKVRCCSVIRSMKDTVPQYVLAAEEFVVLPYLGFIQNILGRIRTIVLGSLFLFVAATLAASSCPDRS